MSTSANGNPICIFCNCEMSRGASYAPMDGGNVSWSCPSKEDAVEAEYLLIYNKKGELVNTSAFKDGILIFNKEREKKTYLDFGSLSSMQEITIPYVPITKDIHKKIQKLIKFI